MKFSNAAWCAALSGMFGFAAHGFAASGPLKLALTRSLSPLMTVIRYEDREPEQPAYVSRILVLGEKMRMDYGKDDEGFILFDRKARSVWHVSPGDRRMTGIAAGKVSDIWPPDWQLTEDAMSGEQYVLTQIRLNGTLCVEFKTSPLLPGEAALFADFRRILAANQVKAWLGTPEELRAPCALALDVHAAGIEYRGGLPLAIRYWDGRSRIYKEHAIVQPRPALFELPAGYAHIKVGSALPEQDELEKSARSKPVQGKSDKRQPSASQAR